MLVVQPYLEFRQPLQEPFVLTDECATRLLSGIDNVLSVCDTLAPHFVVFPEFSLPGVDAVDRLKSALMSRPLPRPLIVIGGVHGLSSAEYARLCALPGVSVHVDPTNAANNVGDSQWVNTSVTFVRNNSGDLSLWLQPKLSPSWPEANTPHQSMFQGGAARIFRARFDNGVPCRFLSLLCFDWIGRETGSPVPDAILTQFNSTCQSAGSPQSVHWAFVIQYNRQPNHHTFLTAASEFLTRASNYPYVQRHDAAVVMACTASSRVPARRSGSYGYSSLIFSPRAPFDTTLCRPTFCTNSSRYRSSDALGTCKDVVFREMGECIHAIGVRVPAFVVPDVTDRTPPLERAEVFPLFPPVDDPRIPGSEVSPVVKWANDELDDIPDLVAPYFQGVALEEPIRAAHTTAVHGYRRLPSQPLAVRIHASTATRVNESGFVADPALDVDEWDLHERDGLRHVVQSLTLMGSVVAIDSINAQLHARHTANGTEIAAIRGSTHSECLRAFDAFARRTHSPIVLVSRDDNNATHLPREVENFADPRQGAGVKITDSHALLTNARSFTEDQYRDFITELLSVPDRRII